jgi:hypothetical protein
MDFDKHRLLTDKGRLFSDKGGLFSNKARLFLAIHLVGEQE